MFSIGHGKESYETLYGQLTRVGVSFLVDVRSTPYSRHQPEFSREPLERFMHRIGVRYVFMGDSLGGRPSDPGCYTDGRVDYGKTRTKPFFIRGIHRLRSAYEQGLTVCVLCSESQPSLCHRSKLIGEALSEVGIEVVHLLPNGSERTQADVVAELTNGQGQLFGPALTSRKRYGTDGRP